MTISASMDDPDVNSDTLAQLESEAKKLQRTAEDNTPEGIFPYVLYLLSRPPSFPVGGEGGGGEATEAEKKRAEGVFKSLRMVGSHAID